MNAIKITLILLFALSFPTLIFAHDVVRDLESISKSDAIITYISLGFEHILPLGFDHILFIISLVLLSPNLKQLFLQSAAFTVGHCVTLGLAMYDIFKISPSVVEPLIAITIVFIAAENLFSNKLKPTRIVLIFAFGLLHGMGFASALADIGLPQNAYLLSLLMFNLGVELGQIFVILCSYFLLTQLQKRTDYTWSKITMPVTIFIISMGTYWVFERLI
ncbi:MAG: HupE/UreJ family protein [Bacteroidota bacterium]